MASKGVYIAFEGLDGTGKSTLFRNIVEILKSEQISFDTLCPTQISNPNSIPERLYHSNRRFKRISIFRTLIFAYRSYKASRKVKWESNLILGDRSIVVSYVKLWRKILNSPFITIALVNFIEPFIKSPDVIFLLDASESILLNRISQKDVIEIDETPEHLRKMKAAYMEIRTSYRISRLEKSKWIDVDSSKSADDLKNEVYQLILEVMGKKLQSE